MAEVNRPESLRAATLGGTNFIAYEVNEANEYFAALERRLRIAERNTALLNRELVQYVQDIDPLNRLAQRAEREIDSEQKEQEG